MALPILCLAIAACGSKDAPAKSDPNAPAVVKVAPPLLASDTEKKVKQPVVSDMDARNTLARHYALLGTTLAMMDAKTVMQEYAASAEFTTSNGSFVGTDAIAKEMDRLTTGRTIKDFSRTSRTFQIVDSTVVDSGSYAIVSSRPSGGETTERGEYAATWKIQAPPLEWVMLKDHLYPPATVKKPKSPKSPK